MLGQGRVVLACTAAHIRGLGTFLGGRVMGHGEHTIAEDPPWYSTKALPHCRCRGWLQEPEMQCGIADTPVWALKHPPTTCRGSLYRVGHLPLGCARELPHCIVCNSLAHTADWCWSLSGAGVHAHHPQLLVVVQQSHGHAMAEGAAGAHCGA